jgi:hypothetical protein
MSEVQWETWLRLSYQPAFSPASQKCGEEVRERSRWGSDEKRA